MKSPVFSIMRFSVCYMQTENMTEITLRNLEISIYLHTNDAGSGIAHLM